ncbi:MAG: TonB-dependent receptor [Bacteroidales bacterium]|nr:TonB-dependent receptor [Bacteroidales bacterium]
MTTKTILLSILSGLLIHTLAVSQQLTGLVFEQGTEKTLPLPGVNIYWSGTQIGTTSDEKGQFSLAIDGRKQFLVFSFVGYKNDTVQVKKNQVSISHVLNQNLTLDEVVVAQRAKTNFVSRMSTVNAVTITSGELTKAACCNLSESFETSASVDVSYSDAVTGAKQIEMLGLSGIYTQMMGENIPNLRGLATSFGLSYVPGSWMSSIQVSKGTSTIINGYESISGQINVTYKNPMDSEKLFVNLFQNQMGRSEVNVNAKVAMNKRLRTMVLAHVSNQSVSHDNNKDSFLDEPLYTQYNVFNRWDYDSENIEFQFGIKAMSEDRRGGQHHFKKNLPRDTANGYGIGLKTNRYEAFLKTGYIFSQRPQTSVGFQQQLVYHKLDAFFGLHDYTADQFSYYGNLLFQSYLFDTRHTYTTGLSLVYDHYEERLSDSLFGRIEQVPGAFFQYTYSDGQKLNIILGMRADHHNEFGLFFTPRFHLKYNLSAKTTMRLSAGKGYRSANVLAENTSLLASSKRVVFRNTPRLENAWNYGINLSRHFELHNRELTLSFDAYRTEFINQVVVDRDSDLSKVLIYNLEGRSFSNSFQLEANYELIRGLDLTAAFRYNDVKMTYTSGLLEKPMVNKYKGLLSLSYVTNLKKWQFDFTTQFNGQTRLPSTADLPEQYHLADYSPAYTILNAQITKYFRNWNVYLGGENLTNFKQKNPIIGADDPFGPYFDSSVVWGPVYGIKIYAGLRYTIK